MTVLFCCLVLDNNFETVLTVCKFSFTWISQKGYEVVASTAISWNALYMVYHFNDSDLFEQKWFIIVAGYKSNHINFI